MRNIVLNTSLSARVADPDAVGQALAELSGSAVAVTEFALGRPRLDEVFLALTRNAADDHATEQARRMTPWV
jgi:daunorubicin/doxorubicin transport system ATP-binding protein